MPGKGTEEVKEVTIIFNSNDESNTTKQITVEKDKDVSLPENTFKREMYDFLEWNTKADGSGTKYTNKANIEKISQDIILYAIWKKQVEVGKKVETTKKDNYKDEDGEKATVPKGFAIVPGCEDISEGLVISDVENDTANVGNQFVWVPVNPNNFKRVAGFYGQTLQNLSDYNEPCKNGYKNETEEYEEMYNQATKYKGFYIGRYEAGKDSNENVVVKKESNPYIYVPWGNAMDDISGTTNTEEKVGAVKLSKDFATSKGYADVTSTLCYGIQWDTAMQFIDSSYDNGIYDKDSYVKNSTNKGWYNENYNSTVNGNTTTNSNNKTGIDLIYKSNPNIIANKQKNIYDLGGNLREWTMESYGNTKRVGRGGTTNLKGNDNPASERRRQRSYL